MASSRAPSAAWASLPPLPLLHAAPHRGTGRVLGCRWLLHRAVLPVPAGSGQGQGLALAALPRRSHSDALAAAASEFANASLLPRASDDSLTRWCWEMCAGTGA